MVLMRIIEVVRRVATSQDDAAHLLEESSCSDAFCLSPAEILCIQFLYRIQKQVCVFLGDSIAGNKEKFAFLTT